LIHIHISVCRGGVGNFSVLIEYTMLRIGQFGHPNYMELRYTFLLLTQYVRGLHFNPLMLKYFCVCKYKMVDVGMLQVWPDAIDWRFKIKQT
jgi:hypothetical protein